MANLSHLIRSFNRFELKYLVSLRAAERFRDALRANLVPDDHGDEQGVYELASLYYDSPDYRFYWEKMDGIRYRRKLRIRHYRRMGWAGEDTPVFVEIKQRIDRVTQTRRVLLPYRDALRLCSGRQVPNHDPQDSAVVEEAASMVWEHNLQPASLVTYRREAWIGTEFDIGLRVTFDSQLVFRTIHLYLDQDGSDIPLFPPDRVIIEIKVNERVPYWLTELVASHNLNLVRVSKYCRSIELAQSFMKQSMS